MILAIVLSSVLMWSCQPVDGDRILGKHLAAAHPAFAAIAPDRAIAATPAPGVERVLHSGEIARIARDNNIEISAPTPELCFVRATEPLTADRLLPVLQKALEVDAAKIEILDFIRFPVPPGTLEFTRAGLSPNGLWRGSVMYAPGRSMQLWAKVSVTTEQSWVEAASALAPGKTIAPDQLILRTGPRFPFGAAPVDSIDFAAARQPLRSIRPGEPIFASMLAVPREVERGDSITVRVVAGQTELSFSAVAETSGRAGESVLIRNPENGRLFQARIESKGKVLVTK
jgi:flagella basal body P-ring formation protein FlgA